MTTHLFHFDVEADAPSPAIGSMLEIGIAVTRDGDRDFAVIDRLRVNMLARPTRARGRTRLPRNGPTIPS